MENAKKNDEVYLMVVEFDGEVVVADIAPSREEVEDSS